MRRNNTAAHKPLSRWQQSGRGEWRGRKAGKGFHMWAETQTLIMSYSRASSAGTCARKTRRERCWQPPSLIPPPLRPSLAVYSSDGLTSWRLLMLWKYHRHKNHHGWILWHILYYSPFYNCQTCSFGTSADKITKHVNCGYFCSGGWNIDIRQSCDHTDLILHELYRLEIQCGRLLIAKPSKNAAGQPTRCAEFPIA